MLLFSYAFMGGMGISGLIGIGLNVFSVIHKKKKGIGIKNNIVYLMLFALTLLFALTFLFARLLFQAAMSV